MTPETPLHKNGKDLYHLNLYLRQEPIVLTPVNELFVPDATDTNVTLFYLFSLGNGQAKVQLNYSGKQKPLTLKLISKKAQEERESHAYGNLEKVVQGLMPHIGDVEPIETYENGFPLVFFNRDDKGEPDYSKFSLAHFGEVYPDEKETQMQIKYVGSLRIVSFVDAIKLPENYSKPIIQAYGKLREALQTRYLEHEITKARKARENQEGKKLPEKSE